MVLVEKCGEALAYRESFVLCGEHRSTIRLLGLGVISQSLKSKSSSAMPRRWQPRFPESGYLGKVGLHM